MHAEAPEQENSLTQDNRGSSWTPVAVIVLLLIIGGFSFLAADTPLRERNEETVATSTDEVPIRWHTYENRQFGFKIRYPNEGWTITEAPDHEISPRFSIHKHKKIAEPLDEPLDHFATGTYVGIYPHGIPTEGVMGEYTTSTNVTLRPDATSTRTYILANEKPWAMYTKFTDSPRMWESHGFIWGRVGVQNLTTRCLRSGEAISSRECDPMFGDTIIREGMIDNSDWNTIRRILESLSFIQPATTTRATSTIQ